MTRLLSALASAAFFALLLHLSAVPAANDKKPVATKPSQAWTLEEAQSQLQLNPRDPYLQYVVQQLAHRENKLDKIDNDSTAWLGRSEDVDLFSIFTGALAVQESLQMDSMNGESPVGGRNRRNTDQDKYLSLKDRHKEIVNIADLKGPTIKSHPWLKMLAGRKPEIDPLAKMVPEDFFFVQFHSAAKLLEALNNTDLWATHLLNQTLQEARTTAAGDRIAKQLVIETGSLDAPFCDQTIEEVAVTGSDPFVCEGNDATLLFRIKEPKLFKARMDGFLDNAVKARADVKRTEGQYLGISYVQLTTPDREVNVFSAYPTKDIHVRSNSQAALYRVLEAIQGKNADGEVVRRLGDTHEFAYIRAIYPRGAAEEDGFIYLSDPFIRNVVGPKLKLTERRRMICYNHLRMIGNAAMLYRTEHGKPADSLETLFNAGCCPAPFQSPKSSADAAKIARLIADLDSDQFSVRQKASAKLAKLGSSAEVELRKTLEQKPSLEVTRRIEELLLKLDRLCHCPSGGAYQLSADGMTGICTHHGNAHCLTPNLETPVNMVCGDEADEYKVFHENYNQYWRTYFDPIAIRLQITPKRYRLETIVLPLIDNSIYSGMAQVFGGKPENLDTLPVPSRNIFSLYVRLNKDILPKLDSHLLPEALKEIGLDLPAAKKLDVNQFLSQGLGNQIGIHVYDSAPVIDLNLQQMLGQMLGSFNGRVQEAIDLEVLPIAFAVTSLTAPAYLSIPVRDAKIVDGFGDQLEILFATMARFPGFGLGIGNDFYLVPFKSDTKKAMRGFGIKCGPIKLRYFYARIGNTLYIASKNFILEDLLALEQARGKSPVQPRRDGTETTAHAMVKLRAKNWNQVLADYRLGQAENHREACLNNLGPLASVTRAFMTSSDKVDEKERVAIANRIQKETERLYQEHFFCPEGGHYLPGSDGKTMTCTVHGTVLAPRQPVAPAENSVLSRQLENLEGVTVTLTFTEDGLRAAVIIDRK